MSTLTCILCLPLIATIALAFVPCNFGFILRAVALTKLAVDKRQSKQLHICSASALDSSAPRRHAERPLAGLFFPAPAHLASYLTKMIPKKRLEQNLHEAVRMARARLERGRIL